MEKLHLQVMLSDVGYSNFKRQVVFCTETEREDRALRRNKLIEPRKLSLDAHTIKQTSLFAVRLPQKSVWRVVHNSLHLNV
jgi:hypothetical protein